jgi:hypothetical protein
MEEDLNLNFSQKEKNLNVLCNGRGHTKMQPMTNKLKQWLWHQVISVILVDFFLGLLRFKKKF